MTAFLTDLLPFLQYPFMQRALVAGLATGILCAVIGVYVTMRSMSFFSDAISHSALAGIALGVLIGLDPVLAAVFFSVAVAAGITFITVRTELTSDTVIGVFFSGSMALGVLLIGMQKGYRTDLLSYLFGDILAVSTFDVVLSLGLAAVVLAIVFARSTLLLKIAFNRDLAAVEGTRVVVWDYIFMILLALTVAVSVKIVGIVLVSALIIVPAAAARNVAPDFRRLMGLAIVFGAVGALTGLAASYYLDTASGPTMVMVVVLIFVVTLVLRRNR
ncbi:MAG: metal ABC transporter permease [Actinobacteria bacterium]|nr:metal ABC transporter permease [Actinomycetota bacterium]